MVKNIDAGVLNIAYVEAGAAKGWPVVLLHGFPYDIYAYDEVAPLLTAEGARVIVPYLRGYGPTRFLSPETPRSGQQAALGSDLRALLDALDIPSAILAGYDWGGRAACVVAALWPDRAKALVSYNSYNIQDIAKALEPDRRYIGEAFVGRMNLIANKNPMQDYSKCGTILQVSVMLSADGVYATGMKERLIDLTKATAELTQFSNSFWSAANAAKQAKVSKDSQNKPKL